MGVIIRIRFVQCYLTLCNNPQTDYAQGTCAQGSRDEDACPHLYLPLLTTPVLRAVTAGGLKRKFGSFA